MYRDNDFDSFAHASHVTQSVVKLLARVVTPQSQDEQHQQHQAGGKTSNQTSGEVASWHKYTYGITSDPLTQFAVAFSALIHDVDHPGVPNAQLVKEQSTNAVHYKNKSVAEQNSLDIAWNLLMEPCYRDLRACIYSDQTELERFRQLLVNSVMATDIVDKELGALRMKRWDQAFASALPRSSNAGIGAGAGVGGSSNGGGDMSSENDDMNRMAKIVIEHLIQASDVAHTMQHWHVYLKWNEKFF